MVVSSDIYCTTKCTTIGNTAKTPLPLHLHFEHSNHARSRAGSSSCWSSSTRSRSRKSSSYSSPEDAWKPLELPSESVISEKGDSQGKESPSLCGKEGKEGRLQSSFARGMGASPLSYEASSKLVQCSLVPSFSSTRDLFPVHGTLLRSS